MNLEYIELMIPETVVKPSFLIAATDLEERMDAILKDIKISVDSSNMEEIAHLLESLGLHYASSTDIVASAKFYNDLSYRLTYDFVVEMIKKKQIPDGLKSITSPSILKDYVRSRCATFNAYYTRAEKMHSSLTHRIDSLRSLLSKEKEVYKNTYYNNG